METGRTPLLRARNAIMQPWTTRLRKKVLAKIQGKCKKGVAQLSNGFQVREAEPSPARFTTVVIALATRCDPVSTNHYFLRTSSKILELSSSERRRELGLAVRVVFLPRMLRRIL